MSGYSAKPGRIAGTFHDLSDEEKTKAFLQLLEHQLKMDKVPILPKKSSKVLGQLYKAAI